MEARALYNLLRLNAIENPHLDVEPWAIEYYPSIPTEELFKRLEHLKIPLNQTIFLQYAENCDSPEQLADMLWLEEEYTQDFDHAYLLIFELWRRLLPEKQSLSLFCNDLDQLIFLYDQEKLEDEQPLQEALQQLETLLDENVDQGCEEGEIFQTILTYCAHDLESFIYDYISAQIEYENGLYASELIDGFYPYVQNKRWLDFERMRLLTMTDHDEGRLMLRRLLDDLVEDPDLELLLQIAGFLAHEGDFELFSRTLQLARPHLQMEGDFQEILELTAELYRLSDQVDKEEEIRRLLSKREEIPLEESLSASDEGLVRFFDLIS